jgi:hypothetical protein
MKRDQINEWIVKYNEGTLEGRDLEEFMKLLAEDPEIQKEVGVDREIDKMLQEKDLLEFRQAILKAREANPSRKLRWFLLAASLAVLLSAGGFMLYRTLFLKGSNDRMPGKPASFSEMVSKDGQNARNKSGSEMTADSVAEQKNQLLAERFVPLNSLESIVGESTRADDILVQGPASDLKIRCGDSVTFYWKAESPAPLDICLLDNHGTKVMSVRHSGVTKYFLKTANLKPGLYYWKLLKDDQLVTAGKIRLE